MGSSAPERTRVGGQAVIEGVMMRSPRSMAVAVRRPGGEIVVREQPWVSLWERLRFLKWPFFRGSIVLVESLVNGIQALMFSANQAAGGDGPDAQEEKLSPFALAATVAVALMVGIFLFLIVPHFLTQLLGRLVNLQLTVTSLVFHVVDGVIKVAFFLAYVWGISFLPDIRRVFQYHGAEHMAIFAHEHDLELTVENVRRFHTMHPRCGTSFLMLVILVSILLFSALFPFMPALPGWPGPLRQLLYVAIKIPLLLPIAGVSYELIRLAGKHEHSRLLRAIVFPGILLQRITTQPPTDDQLQVAILSLRKVLWREAVGGRGGEASEEVYADFDQAVARFAAAGR